MVRPIRDRESPVRRTLVRATRHLQFKGQDGAWPILLHDDRIYPGNAGRPLDVPYAVR